MESGLILLALICGVRLRFWDEHALFQSYVAMPGFGLQAATFAVLMQTCFYYGGLYRLEKPRSGHEVMLCLSQALGGACLLLGAAYYLVPELLIGRGVLFISTGLVAVFVGANRMLIDAAWRTTSPQRILILGTQDLARAVAQEFDRRSDLNVALAGFVDSGSPAPQGYENLMGRPVWRADNDLDALVLRQGVGRIVVAMEDRRGRLPVGELVRLRTRGILIEDAETALSALSGRVWLRSVKPSWFVFSGGFRRSRVTMVIKRAMDLAIGVGTLILGLPAMILVAAAVRLDSAGPVIYRQERVGRGGRVFHVLKFRSMRENAEADGARWAQSSDDRVTRVGRFLRKYRLDEMPQCVNIILGHMSVVGPRPERPVFVERLREEICYYDERHTVRPGLTGWAQTQHVYGASVEDAARKLEYDLFYLKNMSIVFDVIVILQTIRTVMTGHGAR